MNLSSVVFHPNPQVKETFSLQEVMQDVGIYIPVPISILEDSKLNLLTLSEEGLNKFDQNMERWRIINLFPGQLHTDLVSNNHHLYVVSLDQKVISLLMASRWDEYRFIKTKETLGIKFEGLAL